jgi:hypothetical protein
MSTRGPPLPPYPVHQEAAANWLAGATPAAIVGRYREHANASIGLQGFDRG